MTDEQIRSIEEQNQSRIDWIRERSDVDGYDPKLDEASQDVGVLLAEVRRLRETFDERLQEAIDECESNRRMEE